MGLQYTTVRFEFDSSVFSAEIFDKIDLCFQGIQYRSIENEVTVSEGDDFKGGLALAYRKKLMSSVNYMKWYYDAPEDAGSAQAQYRAEERKPYTAIKFSWSRGEEPANFCMRLMAPVEYRPAYKKREMELAKKVEQVSLCLHESLGAIRTSGIAEHMEEDWFHFSKTKWKTMGKLLLNESE